MGIISKIFKDKSAEEIPLSPRLIYYDYSYYYYYCYSHYYYYYYYYYHYQPYYH